MSEFYTDTLLLLKSVPIPDPVAAKRAAEKARSYGFELPTSVGEWISLDPNGAVLRLYSNEDWPHLTPEASDIVSLENGAKFVIFYTENQGSYELAYEVNNVSDPEVVVMVHGRSDVFPTGHTFSKSVFSRVFEWQCYVPDILDPFHVDPFDDEFEPELDFGQPMHLKLPTQSAADRLLARGFDQKDKSVLPDADGGSGAQKWLFSDAHGNRLILQGNAERSNITIFGPGSLTVLEQLSQLFCNAREGFAVMGVRQALNEAERRIQFEGDFFTRLIAQELLSEDVLDRIRQAIKTDEFVKAFPAPDVFASDPREELESISEQLALKLVLGRIDPYWWEVVALQSIR